MFAREIEARQGVCDYVANSRDVLQVGSIFFENKAPTHYAFSVELLIGEVLVVGVYRDLVSEEDVAKLFQGFYNR